jgi:hypothetical protein
MLVVVTAGTLLAEQGRRVGALTVPEGFREAPP